MKVIACIIARTNSTRLPIKVLRDCGFGYSMLVLLIKRLKKTNIDDIYICTSNHSSDDIMEDIASQNGINVYRGSPDEVIERMVSVAKITKADILLRITGDNPLTSIEYIDKQVNIMEEKKLDYVRLIDVPIGATAEVISKEALFDYYRNNDPKTSEYMMFYLFNPDKYKCGVIKPLKDDYSDYSLTVDTNEDLIRLRNTLKHFSKFSQSPEEIKLDHLIDYYINGQDVVYHILETNGLIKLPHGEEVSYSQLKSDLKQREHESFNYKLY